MSEGALAAIALVLVMAAAIGFNWTRNEKRILQQRFAATIEPDGPSLPCEIRFATEEATTPCIVKPSNAGWYMSSPLEGAPDRSWNVVRPYLRRPVLIPWSVLEYGPAKFPLLNWVRFEIPSTKVIFFVRENVARHILGLLH